MTTERTLTSEPAADTLAGLIADARRLQVAAGLPRPRVARVIDLTRAAPAEIVIPDAAIGLAEGFDTL